MSVSLTLNSKFLAIEDGLVKWLHPVWKAAYPGKDFSPELLPGSELEALVKSLDEVITKQIATVGCAVHDRVHFWQALTFIVFA